MLLTRLGYHSLVIGWLAILGFVDLVANTSLTGIMSDIYFYKVFLDLGLIYWTYLFLKEDLSGTVVSASSRQAQQARQQVQAAVDRGHEAIAKVELGSSEYIYYGFLVVYGLGNFYFHHAINKESAGILSLATLIISVADMTVSGIAGLNFYQVAAGKFVRLQQRLNQ